MKYIYINRCTYNSFSMACEATSLKYELSNLSPLLAFCFCSCFPLSQLARSNSLCISLGILCFSTALSSLSPTECIPDRMLISMDPLHNVFYPPCMSQPPLSDLAFTFPFPITSTSSSFHSPLRSSFSSHFPSLSMPSAFFIPPLESSSSPEFIPPFQSFFSFPPSAFARWSGTQQL